MIITDGSGSERHYVLNSGSPSGEQSRSATPQTSNSRPRGNGTDLGRVAASTGSLAPWALRTQSKAHTGRTSCCHVRAGPSCEDTDSRVDVLVLRILESLAGRLGEAGRRASFGNVVPNAKVSLLDPNKTTLINTQEAGGLRGRQKPRYSRGGQVGEPSLSRESCSTV